MPQELGINDSCCVPDLRPRPGAHSTTGGHAPPNPSDFYILSIAHTCCYSHRWIPIALVSASLAGICYALSLWRNMTSQTASINRKELFLRACRGEALPRVPVWMMRQAGRYLPEYREIRAKHPFLEVCKTPQLAVEVSIQPFRRLGVDAVIVFSDILIPADAMGLKLELGDAGPILPSPVRCKWYLDRLKIFDPERETASV